MSSYSVALKFLYAIMEAEVLLEGSQSECEKEFKGFPSAWFPLVFCGFGMKSRFGMC